MRKIFAPSDYTWMNNKHVLHKSNWSLTLSQVNCYQGLKKRPSHHQFSSVRNTFGLHWTQYSSVKMTFAVRSQYNILLLYIYNDLGQIFECGFNLASKTCTFFFERACVALYRTAYMPQWKTFKQSMTYYTWMIWLDLLKHNYRNLMPLPGLVVEYGAPFVKILFRANPYRFFIICK